MFNLKNNKNFIIKSYHHIFALILVSTYYFLSLVFFKEIVLNPHDNLDHITVYDHIIGKIFNGNLDAASYFLSGTIKWYYIDSIFYPTNLLHLILDDKQFYFFIEVLKKILSYYSFYILAKSISKNKFNSSVSAIFFSSIVNMQHLYGFGIVAMPYFLYMLVKKQKLKPKHFFIIIFIGLNSSLSQDYLALCLLVPLSILITQSIKNLNTIIKYFLSLSISMVVCSLPVIFSLLEIKDIHRSDFEILSNYSSLKHFFDNFLSRVLIKQLEGDIILLFFSFLSFFILIASFMSKKKNLILLTIFLILIFISSIFIDSFLKNIFIFNFLQGFNFSRIDRIIPLMVALLIVYNLSLPNNYRLNKVIYFLSIFIVIIIHISLPIKEAGKALLKNNLKVVKYTELKKNIKENEGSIKLAKFLLNKNNYQKKISLEFTTMNSFDNYYKFEAYAFIKSIVKQDRVMSLGLDPMVAVMNDLRAIDGYHTIYSKSYKKKFRRIISSELETNKSLKDYYDKWGSRVYAFYSNSNDLKIDFIAAKNIGASYVISAFPIKNINLQSICSNCHSNKDIFLYKIL